MRVSVFKKVYNDMYVWKLTHQRHAYIIIVIYIFMSASNVLILEIVKCLIIVEKEREGRQRRGHLFKEVFIES